MAAKKKAADAAKMTAGQVLEVMTQKLWSAPAHAVLCEVRNRTGYSYGKRDRYADALVASLWPSRGMWFAGVEVKVSRSDWLSEMRDPEKSSEIQKYCDYWWLVTTFDIVKEGELPERWGHIEVAPGSYRIAKQAPLLDAEPPSTSFVCSILRNAAEGQQRLIDAATIKAYKRAEERYDVAEVERIRTELAEAKSKQFSAETKAEGLRKQLDALRDYGIDAYTARYNAPQLKASLAAVEALSQLEHSAVTYHAKRLIESLETLGRLRAEAQTAAKEEKR